MALTIFQREVVRLLSANRKASGESYVAGGAALNLLLQAPRLSEDVDVFHDSHEAVHASCALDCSTLEQAGYETVQEIDRGYFVQVLVSRGGTSTRLQWSTDSAYRFFPLVEHPDLGLTLHPFDLATNKVLALVGRALPRDWVDIIECDQRLQPLGYLVWAASGKDPGLNPVFILAQAGRSARYTEVELSRVEFEGERPTAAELSIRWHRMMDEAKAIVEELPSAEVGCCVLDSECNLARFAVADLVDQLRLDRIRYHAGRLGGAFPKVVEGSSG